MSTHVVILAQGRQERMGDSTGGLPKQLLPLPACGDVPILGRTLVQLQIGLLAIGIEQITIVAWPQINQAIGAWFNDEICSKWRTHARIDHASLADPGNSSLKGIARYLDQQDLTLGSPKTDRTVVLLGDVVYSWRCLECLMSPELVPLRMEPLCFVGTSDISPSGGELWGCAWHRSAHDTMMAALEAALVKHPPYQDTYQPGQLRRWMWSLHPSFQTTPRYGAVDDYTYDIDKPSDIHLLMALSDHAVDDDREHGVTW